MNFYPTLERCPDCGGEAKVIAKTGFLSSDVTVKVGCTRCGKETAMFTYKDLQQAIDRASETWNEQAKPEKETKKPFHIKKTFKPDFRPCYANGKKALFHRWNKRTDLVLQSKNLMTSEDLETETTKARETGNVPSYLYSKPITNLFAIVEYEDGTIDEVEPKSVRFIPGIMNDYAFEERETDE